MARLQLNKSSLAREVSHLRTYERFLPSLDLKRQQLMGEKAKAEAEVLALEEAVEALAAKVGQAVPMLGHSGVDLTGLVRLKDYQVGSENVVGTRLPVLQTLEVDVRAYDPMVKPHWVDDVARLLHDMLEARLRVQVARQRVAALERAVKVVTQRVNLFEKVLIPIARSNIKKIRVHLSDSDMDAVVRSKISKRKRAAAA